MRSRKAHQELTVRAISGTHVVLLAMNLPESKCKGLRGFAIHRTDHAEQESRWLEGVRAFEATDPKLGPGLKLSSRKHPFQDFTWSDYSAQQGRKYTYKVLALKGEPDDLQPLAEVEIDIETEKQDGAVHEVYFNRGAASSQEYSRRFGNRTPGSKGDDLDPTWAWLSRGAHEAILNFIGQAKKGWGLRVCAYEFRLPSVANAIDDAHDRGADVMVLFDGSKEFPADENRETVAKARILGLCYERIPKPIAIPHNKFIVLLKNDKPVAVLTGSTNFSLGGVFGQSNVVHIVNDPAIAGQYRDYWDALVENPEKSDLAPALATAHPLPKGLPPKGSMTVFSPRTSLDALDYYIDIAGLANEGLFITFPFGMHEGFKSVFKTSKASLRYALMDKLLGPGVVGPKRKGETDAAAKKRRAQELKAARDEMIAIRKKVENQIAVGSTMPFNLFDKWLEEKLTGLNAHVNYVHTKYMLVDPLSDNPTIVSGSANFSAASTDKNDENMLIIRGDTRVADIYLGEFMRLWDHYAFREWASSQSAKNKSAIASSATSDKPWYLDTTDGWWKRYYGKTTYSRIREYFTK